ncbi:GSCFA domain-containing protein [Mesonia maritima]|uniref:GSCFA domain-containing protein n=1 Tax=Mesonia maritima TaxID=1793873 RepID=A0ABU1K8A6_9FLAO|nr:GSCFA domain-containing protein [Mesonia maritima]MDR6301849.1 hypothetical protein [Mesonia maritima]
MKLQTQVSIPEGKSKIDYRSKIVLLGSCFSENIGEKFQYYKFQSLQNPLGILFHPFAIERFLQRVVQQEKFATKDIFQHQEIYSCFEAHSRMNALSEDEILQNLNAALEETFQFLKKASHVIITLGTSWIYKHVEQNTYVANCHKIPQKNFRKELSSIAELEKSIQTSVEYIRQLNSDCQFIFTVSPVRHSKDGFVENLRSKSHLISALHQVLENKNQLNYFPSYELMMDELRDYRFYAEDLLHPSKIAVQYIWEKFAETWFSSESLKTMTEVEKIQQGLHHRAFNPKSEAHQQFQEKLQQRIKNLQKELPHLSFYKK